MNIKECIFKVSCAPKKRKQRKCLKLAPKIKLYTLSTIKTQMNLVLFGFGAFFVYKHNSESTEKAQNKSMLTKPQKYLHKNANCKT